MELIIRFGFNLIMLTGIMVIVCKLDKVKQAVTFSLAIFNVVVFILSSIFSNHEMSLGSGLGMFALFTLIRYRSEPIRMMELSYILIAVAFGIINAIYPGILTFLQVISLEVSILIIMSAMLFFYQRGVQYKVRYDKLELLNADMKPLLYQDLYKRLGQKEFTIKVETINYKEDYAILTVSLPRRKRHNDTKKLVLNKDSLKQQAKIIYSAS